ncbi:MAG: FimB/Mfa2 family fimbrial subunit [Marinifilaceae bacterium]
MRNLFLGLLLTTALLSCSKEENSSHQKELQKVVFNVSTFTQTNETIKSDPAEKEVNHLKYIVYKENGDYVHQIEQTREDSDFGVIHDELEAGNYYIVLGACHANDQGYPEISTKNEENFSELYFGMRSENGDNFFGITKSITIGEETLETDLTLNRLNGKFQLSFNDKIPDNIDRVDIELLDTRNHIYMTDYHCTHNGSNRSEGLLFTEDGREKKERVFTIYSFPYESATARIIGYDSSNVKVFTLDIPNINIKANTITKCSGVVFKDDGTVVKSSSNLKIAFNYEWDSTTEITF